MPTDLTLHLETYFLAFIGEVVACARYNSPDHVVQTGLRLLERRERSSDALATARQEGEASGLAEDLGFDELTRTNAGLDAAGSLLSPKKITFRLETDFLTFIEDMIASGRFSSPTQVVQAGLRLLEEGKSRGKALRAAIQEGLESGWVDEFNLDEFLAEMRSDAAKNVSDVA
jgi:antitoxin ParD1/3/4